MRRNNSQQLATARNDILHSDKVYFQTNFVGFPLIFCGCRNTIAILCSSPFQMVLDYHDNRSEWVCGGNTKVSE